MRFSSSAAVALVALYFADELIFDGQYRQLAMRALPPISGNENAVTHGQYSRRHRGDLLRAVQEQRKRGAEWAAKAPKTDYGAIIAQLKRLKEQQEGR